MTLDRSDNVPLRFLPVLIPVSLCLLRSISRDNSPLAVSYSCVKGMHNHYYRTFGVWSCGLRCCAQRITMDSRTKLCQPGLVAGTVAAHTRDAYFVPLTVVLCSQSFCPSSAQVLDRPLKRQIARKPQVTETPRSLATRIYCLIRNKPYDI